MTEVVHSDKTGFFTFTASPKAVAKVIGGVAILLVGGSAGAWLMMPVKVQMLDTSLGKIEARVKAIEDSPSIKPEIMTLQVKEAVRQEFVPRETYSVDIQNIQRTLDRIDGTLIRVQSDVNKINDYLLDEKRAQSSRSSRNNAPTEREN